MQLFDIGVERLRKTMFGFGESPGPVFVHGLWSEMYDLHL
jgi:hypothetical protein